MSYSIILFVLSFIMFFFILFLHVVKNEKNILFALTKTATFYVLSLGVIVNILGYIYQYTLLNTAIIQFLLSAVLFICFYVSKNGIIEKKLLRLDKYEMLLFCLVVCFSVFFYAKYGIYYLYADRDPFFYTASAIRMTEFKTFFVEVPNLPEEILDQVALVSNEGRGKDTNFLPFITGLLAVGYDIGGRIGLTIVNPVLAGMALLWIYYYVEKIMNRNVATLSVLLFMVNPAMIWNARIPQSEIICIIVIFSSAYYLYIGLKNKNNKFLYIGAVVLSVIHLLRIDMYFCGLAMSATMIALGFLDKKRANLFWKAYYTYMILSMIFFAFSILESYNYVIGHWNHGVLMYLCIANYSIMFVCIILRLLMYRIKVQKQMQSIVHMVFHNKYITAMWIIVSVLITVYFRFINSEYVNFPKWYMVYTTEIVFVLMLIGIMFYFKENVKNWSSNLFLCALGVAMLIVYLYAPNIAWDNMWMSRRWITVCIPFTIIMAIYALSKLVKWVWVQRALVLILVIVSIYSSRGFLLKDFYVGLDFEYERIEEHLDSEKVYFSSTLKFLQFPLRYYCFKPVFSIDVNTDIESGARAYIENNGELLYIGNENEYLTLINKLGGEYWGQIIYDGEVRTHGLIRQYETIPTEECEIVVDVNIYSIKKVGE